MKPTALFITKKKAKKKILNNTILEVDVRYNSVFKIVFINSFRVSNDVL